MIGPIESKQLVLLDLGNNNINLAWVKVKVFKFQMLNLIKSLNLFQIYVKLL